MLTASGSAACYNGYTDIVGDDLRKLDIKSGLGPVGIHTGQKYQNYGWSGAASVLLFIITLALGCITFYLNRDTDEIAKKKQRKKLAKQAKLQNKQFGGLSL